MFQVIAIVVIASLPHFGFAQANSDISYFCTNPVEAICGKSGEGAQARDKQAEDLIAPVRAKAVLDTIKSQNLGNFTGNEITLAELKKLVRTKEFRERVGNKAAGRVMPTFYENFMEGIGQLFDQLLRKNRMTADQLQKSFQFDRVKGYLNSAVAKSELDMASQKFIVEKLKKIELYSISDLIRHPYMKTDQPLRAQYIDGCKYDGDEDNDFAVDYFRVSDYKKLGDHKDVMVPCMRAVIAALNPTYKLGLKADTIMLEQIWTIGHEVAHHFDPTVSALKEDPPFDGEKAYAPMYQCLEKNFVDNLALKPSKEYADGKKYAKLTGDERAHQIVKDHIGEIGADHFGNLAMNAYWEEKLKSKSGLSPEIMYNILKENLMGLCYDSEDQTKGDEGIHPSAKFRIEMARLNPQVASILGCPNNRPKQVTCIPTGASWR